MNEQGPRLLVAPDSFKGSLEAQQFCAIAEQVLSSCVPGCEVVGLPLADGGEGTAAALVGGTGGELRRVTVTGPMGAPVDARYGVLGDGRTAVVEMAQASGLPLVPVAERDPLRATSYGTGQLIAEALDGGAQQIILALGGSATNDGGIGALQALGFRFLDGEGRPVPPNGAGLARIEAVDAGQVHGRLRDARLTIASDVTNPLLGERGATATYGPQKGADRDLQQQLEQALAHFAVVTAAATGSDCHDQPGAGAAGGMGFGFLSYAGATLRSGFEVVAETYRLTERLAQERWDLLITGEGQVDSQSLQGKLVGQVAALGQRAGVPVVVVAGSVSGDLDPLYRGGVTSVSSIVEGPVALEQAMADAPRLLRRRLTDLCRLWWCGRTGP